MTQAMQPGITITRTFPAKPQAVFDAWTDPAQFAQWFGTAGTAVEDVSMDVRAGGEWAARMVIDADTSIDWHGSYVEVDPPSRLVLTLSDRPGDEYELVTVVLTEVDGGTEMLFTQSGGHMDAAGYAQAEVGWQGFFTDLANLPDLA